MSENKSILSLAIKQVISDVACCSMQILECIVEIVVEDVFGSGVSQVRVCHIIAD
jgi:hypothetical protein